MTLNDSFTRIHSAAALASVMICLVMGCGGAEHQPDLPDDTLWISAHFRYHARASDNAACESVLEQLERHFEITQTYLGFLWPADLKIDYYKFTDRADFLSNSGCTAEAGSCIRGSTVLSPKALQPHELVHAYLSPLGLPPAFFVEGTATVLACEHAWTVNPRAFEEVVALPYGDDRVYNEGPWFVGHLLHRYGPERYLSLYGRLNYTATLAEISAAFLAAYGESLADVWAEAIASSQRTRCVNLWACNSAPLAMDGSAQTLARACDGTDVFRTFELEADGDLLLAPKGYFLYAPLSCDEELPYAIGSDSPGDDVVTMTSIAPLQKGRYFVGPWEESGEVRARILPSKAFSNDCAEAHSVDLSAEEFTASRFELTIPNDGQSWYVKLHPASAHSIFVSPNDPIQIDACLGCEEPASCQPVDFMPALDAEGNALLRLTATASGPGYVTTILLHQISALGNQ